MKNARPHNQAGTSAKDQFDFSAKSTANEAQRARIMEALRAGPKTTEQLRHMGIYYPPARVKELRCIGHEIDTERVNLYDRDGFLHPRCARYHLIREVAQ